MGEDGGMPAQADLAVPATPPPEAGLGSLDGPAPALSAGGRPRWLSRTLRTAALLLVAVMLFLCYFTLSRTASITADGASNALQAWSMLHGNWLLRGWWLSDVSFYTTELPEYLLIETVRGLNPAVVHIAAALTYTLLVLGAAWLAKGRATGREAVTRMVLAGGIMLAPQLAGVQVLMLAPDHVGSAVPVLAVLLLLDRAPRRWWMPVLTGVVLAVALVADNVLVVTAVLPLLVVCGVRLVDGLIRRRQPPRSAWLELSLAGAAVAAVGVARGVLAVIAANGGFTVWAVRAGLVSWSRVLTHLRVLPQGLALLFGVRTTGHASLLAHGLALLHLAGLGLAAWAVGAALWRFRRLSLVDQLLVSAVLTNLVAFVFFTPGAAAYSARDYSAVLPLSAALAGRMAGKRLMSGRVAPVTAAVLAGYVLSLATVVSTPPAATRDAHLVDWLMAHHLDYGLAGYGAGNTTTLDTGNRVHVVVVVFRDGHCYPLQWEAQASDYDSRLHNATFMVPAVAAASVRRVFGTPDLVHRVGSYTVLVWHKNLLAEVQRASSKPGHGRPAHHSLLGG